MEEKSSLAISEDKPSNRLVIGNEFDRTSSVDGLLALAVKLKESQFVPEVMSASDVMVTVLMGRDLGLPAMVSINNINCIQGRASLNVHSICALCLKAGITWKFIKDFEKIQVYRGNNLEWSAEEVKDTNKFQILTVDQAKDTTK